MDKKENGIYRIISILLIIGITILLVDVIIPRYIPPKPEKILKEIDFSNSAWIEDYAEQTVGVYGKDFYINTAFTYNIRSNKLVLTYASQKSVDDAREYYLGLPGAELTGRNDETSLNVTALENSQTLRVYNYYSSVSRVFEIELILNPDNAALVIGQLETAFPGQQLAAIPEIQELAAGNVYGGYVRYGYDQLDVYSHPYLPIYSRAFFYSGTEEDFLSAIAELEAHYPNYRYDETQDAYHFKIGGQIISLGHFMTDSGETVVSIALQEDLPQQ
jgi:hypothetical protein